MNSSFRAATAILVVCVLTIIINCQKHGDDEAIAASEKNRGGVSLSFDVPETAVPVKAVESKEKEAH